MSAKTKTRCMGILTSGGDCPGLNAAIRAICKTALNEYGIMTIGIMDGFRGLVENRTVPLDDASVSGILTRGGTILGTSRDKPNKIFTGGRYLDMTDTAVENARNLHMDCLVCLGGGGTQKNAYRLSKKGVPVITLPKTIDNDVWGTDVSFGFDTALSIATDAIDRLHTTATSHHRIIVCEVMGHKAGWLALQAGIAGGADVILIPEIPYNLKDVANFIMERRRSGKRFSIISLAEGALSVEEAEKAAVSEDKPSDKTDRKKKKKQKEQAGEAVETDAEPEDGPREVVEPMASRVARKLQELTGVEARVTSLGHVQRGGVPTAFDRSLCTLLGVKAAELAAERRFNVMAAYRNGECVPVDLEEIVGKARLVPPNHPLINAARRVGSCLGDSA